MCAMIVDGIPVDPELPPGFDDTRNEDRPESHLPWWHRPYVVTESGPAEGDNGWMTRAKWLEYWPSGVRYDVRCLDGGAWDRSTWWGSFNSLAEAIACAKAGGGSVQKRYRKLVRNLRTGAHEKLPLNRLREGGGR